LPNVSSIGNSMSNNSIPLAVTSNPSHNSSSNVSYSSIWSPAAIAPVTDLMTSNSCMQRASAAYHHHQMANTAPSSGYTSQGYGHPPSAYHYSNMDYLPPPMPHHPQLGAVTSMSSSLNQMSGNHPTMASHMNSMSGHGLHGSGHGHQTGLPPRSSPLNGGLPTGDCLEYNSEKTSWKFQRSLYEQSSV
jgi:hypothetical protein